MPPDREPPEKNSHGIQTQQVRLPDEFNAGWHFVDRNVEQGREGEVAIECGEERVTYELLLQRTNRAGNALRKLGVRAGQRVMLLMMDSPEFLYCFFGAVKIGAVAVPVNTQLRPEDYEYLLNDSEAPVAVVSEDLLPRFLAVDRNRLPHLREVAVVGAARGGGRLLKEILEAESTKLQSASTGKDDVAFWLYSSGSTGRPKACVHRHHDMVVCAELYARNILGMSSRDRCYSVARLFFAYGLGNAGYFPLHFGATTILSPARPTPGSIFADIERYRPTLLFSVPSNFAALAAYRREDGREFDVSSIRHAISAGEALPVAVYERFRERFGIEILDALGSTETLHMMISNRPGEVRPGSSGRVIPGYEARLVNDDGSPTPRGEIGNLLFKGDSTCAGYWNQPEKSREVFEGEWFRTGDKYSEDKDGYFWYAGRANDLFKVNGQWVGPADVEGALVAHADVLEAAVVARKDENGLTKPMAYVVTKQGCDAGPKLAAELQEWVGRRIGGYKKPRWIRFLPELPKTATGKLQRYKLRELLADEGDGKA